MKKFKKVLSLISCAAMAAACTSNAEAICPITDKPLEAPLGYTQFDDKGLLETYGNAPYYDDYVYAAYRRNGEEQTDLYIYDSYKYNYTVFNVLNEKIEVFDEIYSRYSEQLDMDYYYRANPPVKQPESDVEAKLYDMYGKDGRRTNDPEMAEDKSEFIKKMTEEMYEAGCIDKAEYTGMTANATYGWYTGVSVRLNIENEEEEYDNVKEIAGRFQGGEITSHTENDYRIYVDLTDSQEFNDEIKAAYPSANVVVYTTFLSESDDVYSETADILSELKSEPAILYGDIGFDGKVGIQDVVAMNKAINGSVILNAEQQKAADLNGDGNIDGDDMDLLLRFLVDLIDSVPTTK